VREAVIGAFEGPGVSPNGVSPFTGAPHDLWPGEGLERDGRRLTAAAVLVALVEHGSGMTVLLTQRTETLKSHSGQISFPGGRRDTPDGSPEETALREAEEEIGLSRRQVELVGRLSTHDTGTGYRVIPVVGLVAPPISLVPAPAEVAEVFEVPLDFILDPANHTMETRVLGGVRRETQVMRHDGNFIWGLTARLLKELSDMLRR